MSGIKLPRGEQLTNEQVDIINLPYTKDWVISGAPGTGKTVMAIYRAGQLARAKKVLILVYNRPLMLYLKAGVKGNAYRNCEINTYYSWVNEHFGIKCPAYDDEDGWNRLEAKARRMGKAYDHVIIDEAQDFPIQLIRTAKAISKNITCFVDPNQAIEAGKTNTIHMLNQLCIESPYELTRNFRCTKPINDLAKLFWGGEGEYADSFEPGIKPTMIKCDDYDDQTDEVCRFIEQNPEKDIGIIVNNKNLKVTYETIEDRVGHIVPVQMFKTMTSDHTTIDFDLDGVKIVSYGAMKGLEFNVVILPRFEKVRSTGDAATDRNRTYVAITRAVKQLRMLYFGTRISAGWIDTMGPILKHKTLVDWK